MSYESKLDNKSGKLINPAQLCLLISVGLHLLVLKFGLPTLNFNDESGRREVSVIELNPEQQARLPDLYPQQDSLNVPNLADLPPVDNSQPAAPFAIPPSLIPGVGDPNNLSPLLIPPPPNFNLPNLPPITDITLPPIGDLSQLPLPPTINPEDFKVDPAKLPPPNTDKPAKPSTTTAKETDLTPTPNQPQTQPDKKPVKQPETQTKPTPQQIAAKKAANTQQRIRKLSQSLKKNPDGTSDEEATKNYIAWLAKVQDVKPEAIEVAGTYPRDACIRRLKGTSVYGAVVDTEGNVVALDLIKGANYPIFDEAAGEEIIRSVLNNDTEKPKPYQVTVNYKYDAEICPSLTLPSVRKRQEAEQQKEVETEKKPLPGLKPEPEPEPAPKPVPEPEPKPAPKPAPKPVPEPEPKPAPKPASPPTPSLRDRLRDVPLPNRKPSDLRDVPLPNRKPSDLRDVPLPDRPNFRK